MEDLNKEQKIQLARLKVISALNEYSKVIDLDKDADESVILSVMLQSMFDTNLKKDTAEMCSIAVFKNNMSLFSTEQADRFLDTYSYMKEMSDKAIIEDLTKYIQD